MLSRKTTSNLPLSPTLDKKLMAYAVAIGTTCVGALATPQAAEAKIVYTPANRTITFDGKSILDLNNDHIADFVFNGGGLGNHGAVWVRPFNSNLVVGTYWAAVFPEGAEVGPGEGFTRNKAAMEAECNCSTGIDYVGPWLNATNQYLGLEITINGQHHFGWARLTMVAYGEATLTGYAYETVAGKAIVTGATSDDDADSEPEQASNASSYIGSPSLGLLARGADGLELWRRD